MAKDVITRFKLETTAFDSAIKKASKELSDYSKTATKAKEGFNEFTKSNVDAARALGTMATSSTNTKQKLQELVGAYNEGVKAYKALSDEHKKSDWAQALAGSLTQLQQRIKETKQEMQSMSDASGKMGGGGLFSGDKLSGMLQVFGGNLMTKGAGMLTGMASEIGDLINQGVQLAKQGEGIRIAFERLGRGDILDGLREATHGTVTDIELMKAAVKFNDFKLPVEELGTMLAFAQQKAKDTGQSVDYMVDSIVTGLGRKSLMILDNLGLSATEIRNKMKETGDMTKAVGAIIREQMSKAGDYVETAADRAAQANVSLQNKMEELGRKFAPVEEASNQLWTSIKIGILDIIGGPLATMLNQLTEAGRLKNALNNLNGDDGSGNTKVGQQLSALRGSNYKNDKYKSQLAQYDKQIDTYQRMIDNGGKLPGAPAGSGKDVRWLKSQMDAIKSMRSEYVQGAKDIMKPVETNIKTDKSEQNVKTLTARLKELEKQRKDAVKKGDQEQVEALTKQISQVKTNLGYLNPNANKTGSSTKTEQTELQQNQTKINALTQEYVRLGDESTEAARERQAEIQKEIELLQKRNGLLGLRMEQAQGRFLVNAGDFDRDTKNVGGVGKLEQVTNFGKNIEIPSGGLQLSDKLMSIVGKQIEDQNDRVIKAAKERAKGDDGITKLSKGISGLNSITGGLEKMGIEIPSEIQSLVGVIEGVMMVIQGVQTIIGVTQTTALATNTAAIISLESAIWANTAASWFPFARGGIVPHAAGGYFVGGGRYSGDTTPIMANAGELVLNRAQQGNLAAQLEGNNLQNLNLTATIRGEQIRLALNSNGRRTGRGEYVQSNRQ